MQFKSQTFLETMNYVEINGDTVAYWQKFCNQCLELLAKYRIFIDSYVLEFFSEDLWNKVPKEWQTALSQLSPQQLAAVLQPPDTVSQVDQGFPSVLPLSFLAFRAATFRCSLPRTAVSSVQPFLQYLRHSKERNSICSDKQSSSTESCTAEGHSNAGNNAAENEAPTPQRDAAVLRCLRPAWPSDQPGQALWQDPEQELCKASGHHTLLSHVFRRHLKPKKQHEVARLALVAALAASTTRSLVTADIGGGCGHLARLMAYGYNMEVVCVDREQDFVRGARKFDAQLEQSIQKLQRRLPPDHNLGLPAGPRHAACLLQSGLLPQKFLETVVTPRRSTEKCPTDVSAVQGEVASSPVGVHSSDPTTFGLTGLHTCGDLAPLMLRLFLNSPQCCYVASVACCYMKLSVAADRDDVCAAEVPPTPADALLQEDIQNTATDIRDQIHAHCQANNKPEKTTFKNDSILEPANDLDEIRTQLERLDGRMVQENVKGKDELRTFRNKHSIQIEMQSAKEICRSSIQLSIALRENLGRKKVDIESGNAQQNNVVDQNENQSSNSKHIREEMKNDGCTVETLPYTEYNNKTIREIDSSAAEKHNGVRGDGNGAEDEHGYPMSQHCGRHPSHELSYAARELACHALEAYAERLSEGADNLKVHCYRAALERLLVRHYPQHRRAGLRPVRHAHTKAFHEYAKSAVSALDGGQIQLPEEELQSLETEEMLARWRQVIVFYSLRLMLAPVIETVVLLDRCFYLYENDVDCTLVPAFDPKLSPRNMILLAAKKPR